MTCTVGSTTNLNNKLVSEIPSSNTKLTRFLTVSTFLSIGIYNNRTCRIQLKNLTPYCTIWLIEVL